MKAYNKYSYFASLFLIYSFIGWILDTGYRSLLVMHFAPGSVTILPFTPIYGFGALLIIYLNSKHNFANLAQKFLGTALIGTGVEYLGGIITMLVLGHRLWDYSDQAYNLHGIISLSQSISWGILGVILLQFLHPFVKSTLKKLDFWRKSCII